MTKSGRARHKWHMKLGSALLLAFSAMAQAEQNPVSGHSEGAITRYDLVINGGRVIDPESGLDAQRSVGIVAGKIATISASPLSGRKSIDATGLIVSPGFIDLHSHAQ